MYGVHLKRSLKFLSLLKRRAYSFGTYCFQLSQLNSETRRLCRRSFPIPKRMCLPCSESFVGNLKMRLSSQVVTKKHIKAKILAKSTTSSSSRSRRFGRPSKPTIFGRQYQKNRIMKPAKNRRQPTENRSIKRIGLRPN